MIAQRAKRILRSKSDLAAYICLAIIVSIYAYIQIIHFTPAYQEVDPDGYLILAKRIAERTPLAVRDDDPFMYQSHVWVENKDGEVAPKFAPGYPFLMAIAYLFGGDTSMFLVSPIMGGLAIIGAYLLFRMWSSRVSALFGALYLATNAMILVYCGYLLTHASDMCFIVWGMFFLWRWKRQAFSKSLMGILAGLLLGGAVTMRHTSAAFVLVFITAIILRWIEGYRNRIYPVRDTAIILAAYCLFPIILGIYNWSVFDSPYVTGYGLSGEQMAFKLKNIATNARILGTGLNYTGLFFMFPVGIAGMLLAGSIGESLMVAFWIVPIYLIYSFYYWAPNGMAYFRFLIGTFPAIVGAGSALMDKATSLWQRKAIVYLIIVGFVIFMQYGDTESALQNVVSDFPSQSLAYSSQRISAILSDDAVIFSRRPVFCYLGTRRHFRLYDLDIFTASYGASAFTENTEPRRHPLRNDRLRNFYKGLTDDDLQIKKSDLIRRFLLDGRQVTYFLPGNYAQSEQNVLGDKFRWKLIDNWDLVATNINGIWQGETWYLYDIKLHKE